MSSISLSLKMMLAASACAGLTLLACGGDDSGGGGSTDEDDKPAKDAGKGKDAGKDAGKRDAATIATVTPGDDCDPEAFNGLGGPCERDACDAPPCLSQCVDGVYDECKSAADLIGELAGDGGIGGLLRDSGFSLPDTGITRTDAGFTIPGNDGAVSLPTNECPDEYMCDSTLSMVGLPATCVKPGENVYIVLNLPPKCTTNAECTDLGLTGTCFTVPGGLLPAGSDKVCLSPCK